MITNPNICEATSISWGGIRVSWLTLNDLAKSMEMIFIYQPHDVAIHISIFG